jgi:hypothetical protein
VEVDVKLKMKKLKVVLAVAAVGFVVTASLVVWLSLATLQYVASTVQNINPSHVAALKSHVTSLPDLRLSTLQGMNCWQKAQSLMEVLPWVERPVGANLEDLHTACFGSRSAVPEADWESTETL